MQILFPSEPSQKSTVEFCLAQNIQLYYYNFVKTASSSPSSAKDALNILENLTTPASLLFDPKHTSRKRRSPSPSHRTFPPSPTGHNLTLSVPSTISIQNLDNNSTAADMDRKHPSSFQQLEKLGEGTYATVSVDYLIGCRCFWSGQLAIRTIHFCTLAGASVLSNSLVHFTDLYRSSKGETARPESW